MKRTIFLFLLVFIAGSIFADTDTPTVTPTMTETATPTVTPTIDLTVIALMTAAAQQTAAKETQVALSRTPTITPTGTLTITETHTITKTHTVSPTITATATPTLGAKAFTSVTSKIVHVVVTASDGVKSVSLRSLFNSWEVSYIVKVQMLQMPPDAHIRYTAAPGVVIVQVLSDVGSAVDCSVTNATLDLFVIQEAY